MPAIPLKNLLHPKPNLLLNLQSQPLRPLQNPRLPRLLLRNPRLQQNLNLPPKLQSQPPKRPLPPLKNLPLQQNQKQHLKKLQLSLKPLQNLL